MNKLFKTLALLISTVTGVSVIAIDHNAMQSGDVIGSIGGEMTRIEEGDITGTIGGSMVKMASKNDVVTPGAQEAYNRKSKSLYEALDSALVYFRGALLTVGSAATLYLIANRMNFANSLDIATYGFACCMGVIVAKEGSCNLFGYRINGYNLEQA